MSSRVPTVCAVVVGLGLLPQMASGDTLDALSSPTDGVTLGVAHVSDVIYVTHGAVRNGRAHLLGNLDLTLELDTHGAGLWRGGTLNVYALGNHGSAPSGESIGDLQVASNIEANQSFRLYELWYQQELLGGAVSVLGGFHDLNSEFYTSDTSAFFVNSSFGIGADIAANAPVSVFNITGLALRVRAEPTKRVAVLVGLYDGDPGDPEENEWGPSLSLGGGQGALAIAEVQVALAGPEAALPGTVRVGAWRHTGEFTPIASMSEPGGMAVTDGNWGVYGTADQRVYHERSGQGLDLFVQLGTSPTDVSLVTRYLGAGATYTGLIPSRDADVVGAAVATSFINGDLPDSAYELTVEVAYRAAIADFFALQGYSQTIVNTGGIKGARRSQLIGIRTDLAF